MDHKKIGLVRQRDLSSVYRSVYPSVNRQAYGSVYGSEYRSAYGSEYRSEYEFEYRYPEIAVFMRLFGLLLLFLLLSAMAEPPEQDNVMEEGREENSLASADANEQSGNTGSVMAEPSVEENVMEENVMEENGEDNQLASADSNEQSGNTGQSLFGLMQDVVTNAKNWSCSLLFDQSPTANGPPDFVDLLDHMEPVTASNRPYMTNHNLPTVLFPLGSRYMFPPTRYHGIDDMDKLVDDVKLAALRSRFTLSICNSGGNISKQRDYTVWLLCESARLHKDEREFSEAEGGYRTRPKRPLVEEELCNFRITLFKYPVKVLDARSDCWFLAACHNQQRYADCRKHNGHIETPCSEIHKPLRLMTASEERLSNDMNRTSITSAQQSEVLNRMDSDGL
jgi:hypothetical protein